ncbi:ORF6N domain-containing protein [Anthocerotibacter panamensis]|uniref:ORF6N domain-containing protein n=1 Tax=Anthocerotibacter panamensis TaxID=2857077 RepID=UPI001C403B83|nr:ORF6N domain-containing protein [Anthocerotibacter panamensis]
MTDPLISVERIEKVILLIRGQKVLLDMDIAQLYGVETRVLNQAVRRNLDRFPEDFMFQLTQEETESLRSQFVISNEGSGRGGRRYLPYAFTEQGVAMLSSVLKSPQAVQVNIEIMRAFVRLRKLLASNEELAQHLGELEQKYDEQFTIIFEAIRQLIEPPDPPKRRMGFTSEDDQL